MDDPIRILHVDDDPDIGELTATFLEREDDRFAVEAVTTPEDGLDRLEASGDPGFDCVVSDYEMPEMDGIEFLEAVRASHPDLPFVLFTGKGSEEIASDAISAGVTDYLQKKPGVEQYQLLANRITNYVERARGRRERQRHLNAIETAREGISILDSDGRFVYVNDAYAELYGYEPGELLGEHWRVLYREEDVPWMREEVLPQVEAEGFWQGETVGRRADGSTFVEDHSLSRTAGGGLVCTIRDVTERRERKRELEEKTARLEALFERSPDMIDVHDAEGTILDVNGRFCEEMGAPADELVGRSVWEIDRNLDRDGFHTVLSELEADGRLTAETEFRRVDGSTFPAEVHIRRLEIGDETRFVVITRNVSDQKRRERELKRQNERLDVFAETISHDLRNPLATAQGYLELVREDGDSAHFERIERSLDRMERIVGDVLWLAREGKEIGATEPIDLARAAEEAWAVVGGEGDRTTLEVADGIGRVDADADRFRQLLENVLANAIEHGGDTVRIESLPGGFAVVDDGPGIPESDRERVFDRGYSTADGGTGIGLAIVEEIADAHGWAVRISDRDGGGARLEFTGIDDSG